MIPWLSPLIGLLCQARLGLRFRLRRDRDLRLIGRHLWHSSARGARCAKAEAVTHGMARKRGQSLLAKSLCFFSVQSHGGYLPFFRFQRGKTLEYISFPMFSWRSMKKQIILTAWGLSCTNHQKRFEFYSIHQQNLQTHLKHLFFCFYI